MSIVIPFSKTPPSANGPSSPPAPVGPFELMAAAQMNELSKTNKPHDIEDGPEFDKWDEALDQYGTIRLPKERNNPQEWLNRDQYKDFLKDIDREDQPDGSVILRKRGPSV